MASDRWWRLTNYGIVNRVDGQYNKTLFYHRPPVSRAHFCISSHLIGHLPNVLLTSRKWVPAKISALWLFLSLCASQQPGHMYLTRMHGNHPWLNHLHGMYKCPAPLLAQVKSRQFWYIFVKAGWVGLCGGQGNIYGNDPGCNYSVWSNIAAKIQDGGH